MMSQTVTNYLIVNLFCFIYGLLLKTQSHIFVYFSN